MNPDCQGDLFLNGVTIGVMAHIIPHADNGDASFENLLILCRNCHELIDVSRSESTVTTLSSWKSKRNYEIRNHFSKMYGSFVELQARVVPILERNLSIFEAYGPESEGIGQAEPHAMWLRFEGEIVANNQKLVLMLTCNRELLHLENREIAEQFTTHASEFANSRESGPVPRTNLFPPQLNSIFGVERTIGRPAPNVSALQNWISHLLNQERFVSLELVPRQVLTYLAGRERREIFLTDTPRVHQIYWTGGFYRPQRTKIRLDSLVFFLSWLEGRNIGYEFEEVINLTVLIVENKWRVFLCYEYCVARVTLYEAPTTPGTIVVNLHNWNDGPFSDKAVEYASAIGVQTMSQKEVFVFAHRTMLND